MPGPVIHRWALPVTLLAVVWIVAARLYAAVALDGLSRPFAIAGAIFFAIFAIQLYLLLELRRSPRAVVGTVALALLIVALVETVGLGFRISTGGVFAPRLFLVFLADAGNLAPVVMRELEPWHLPALGGPLLLVPLFALLGRSEDYRSRLVRLVAWLARRPPLTENLRAAAVVLFLGLTLLPTST